MDEFSEFWELVKKDKENSPWSKKTTILEWLTELRSEINELEEEAKKENYDLFKKELGDAIWDLMSIAAKAEKEGNIRIEEVLEITAEKFKRRKPWILTGEDITVEEELERYQEIKKNE